MYTKELEDEQRNQVVIMKELSELTSVLKETTIDIHSAVNIQNTVRGFLLIWLLSITHVTVTLATDGYAKIR